MNPFLPLTEYVPDGEPHVFGDRVYLYGSHDEPSGKRFCTRDYTVWSAPVRDLSRWTCHGVTYRKAQDPRSKPGKRWISMRRTVHRDPTAGITFTISRRGPIPSPSAL